MWKRRMAAEIIDKQPVNNVLKIYGRVIHIIHGFIQGVTLSTNCQQEVNKHFHKVIHALIVYSEGVDRIMLRPFEYDPSVRSEYR